MTDLELDKMMRRVLSDAIEFDCGNTIKQEIPFVPSRRHQQQMQSMLRNPLNWIKKKTRPLGKQALQWVAVILLVISIGFGGIMAISPTARAAVIRWFVEWYETHIIYRYIGEDVSGELLRYEITELPDGYKETDRIIDPLWVSVVYENPDGGIIYLDYNLIQQGGANTFVPGDDAVIGVTVNQFDGQLFVPLNPESRKMITWIDPNKNIQFLLTANADDAEMLSMAESVSVAKKNEKNEKN